jgi:hypothetical protein
VQVVGLLLIVGLAMSIHHERYKAQRVRERSFLLLILFAVMLFVIFAGMVLAFYFFPDAYDLLTRQAGKTSSAQLIEAQIEDRSFAIPEQLVARTERSFLGPAKRIDLKIPWPFDVDADFAAPPSSYNKDDWFLLTFEPRDGRKSLEQFYADIYRVYLTETAESEDGMTLRRFKKDGPYSDSVIYIDERLARPAVIRCDLEASALGPVLCEHIIVVSDGVLARLRFAKTDLRNWQALENAAHAIIQKIAAPASN